MDKLEKLEMITERLMRRARKKNSAIITPYPISAAVFGEKVEGAILRYMFPCAGTITKGFVRLGAKPKKDVMIKVRLFNDTGEASKGFALEKKSVGLQPNLVVKTGDCLEISLDAGEEAVSECWVAFLWKHTMADAEVRSYLISDLEQDMELEPVK